MASEVFLGIDPGLAHTGWGVVASEGARLRCLGYGCIATPAGMELSVRLATIHAHVAAVVERFSPSAVGVETVWFGNNASSAMATGQARGAALAACGAGGAGGMRVHEIAPSRIKASMVGFGDADKAQVQYMVAQLLGLPEVPRPDHAADALAAAICASSMGREGVA